MTDVTQISLTELCAMLKSGKLTAQDVTAEYLARIEQTSELNSFITVCANEAMEQARRADEQLSCGNAPMLCGVPIAIKDNIETRGIRTTCASRYLDDYVPNCDADVVQKLKALGAVIIGKTNMDEFAFGSANEFSAYGAVKNVVDRSRVPGGSSGGSANAVAARQAVAALGTDTGGSVRQPAAFTGTVGLKPTYGAVSRRGLLGLSPSLEQIGVLARDCDDALVLFDAIRDGESVSFLPLGGDIAGKRIGIIKGFSCCMADGYILRELNRATQKIERLGGHIVEVSVPSSVAGLSAYHAISSAESARTFARHDFGARDTRLLGVEVKRRLITGAATLRGDNYDSLYIRAAKVRTAIINEYKNALSKCDVLLGPTTAAVANKIGEKIDPVKRHYSDVFLAPVSLAGLPAVSIPFGSENGLPIGLQIIGNYNCEREILDIGKAIMN